MKGQPHQPALKVNGPTMWPESQANDNVSPEALTSLPLSEIKLHTGARLAQ